MTSEKNTECRVVIALEETHCERLLCVNDPIGYYAQDAAGAVA